MNEELIRLREVAKAIVAERRAWAKWSGTMTERRQKGEKPTEESIKEMRRLARIHTDCEKDTNKALARLAEVNPEVVNG